MLFICAFFSVSAAADVGPKPSIVVDFVGLKGELYYATLLSEKPSTGPHSMIGENGGRYSKDDADYDIFRKFVEYADADGFYFLQFFQNCSETHRFSWTYYPPQIFKVLLYFPESDSFVVSEKSYEPYAFNSYFTAKISGSTVTAEVKMTTSYLYGKEIIELLFRIVLTIAIEFLVGREFGLGKKKYLWLIVITNIGTQLFLNITLNLIRFSGGRTVYRLVYFVLEVAIVVIEAIIYRRRFGGEIEKKKLTNYAIAANIASFAAGWILSVLISFAAMFY